jgi:uncharacterized glyoxalase superfamily protein PhnB
MGAAYRTCRGFVHGSCERRRAHLHLVHYCVNYFLRGEHVAFTVGKFFMKPTPPGWPRISSSLIYEDPHAAIDWLCRAFGFEVRLKVEGDDGSVHHSELTFGEGLIMVSPPKPEKYPGRRAPTQVGGANTQNMMVYVDDVEAHYKRAKDAGAVIVMEPETHDYGDDYWADRGYECRDIGGHHWWFFERLRNPPTKA